MAGYPFAISPFDPRRLLKGVIGLRQQQEAVAPVEAFGRDDLRIRDRRPRIASA